MHICVCVRVCSEDLFVEDPLWHSLTLPNMKLSSHKRCISSPSLINNFVNFSAN
uniref:Uncharacterized protein n=1 Tax=Anguilla anguilla TaxID=7936 RepID=A0A0E9R8F8_ANGAN